MWDRPLIFLLLCDYCLARPIVSLLHSCIDFSCIVGTTVHTYVYTTFYQLTYTYFLFLVGICFLIGRSYLDDTCGIVGAGVVEVDWDRTATASRCDVTLVQVIVQKEIVLNA